MSTNSTIFLLKRDFNRWASQFFEESVPVLRCEYCLETKRELRFLDCNHSTCVDCMKERIGNLVCPKCCLETRSELNDNLPRNFLTACGGIVQTLAAAKRPCVLCRSYGKTSKSTHICCECNGDALCEKCVEHHNAISATRTHKPVPFETFLTDGDIKEKLEASMHAHADLCSVHADQEEVLTHYCKKCETLMCQKCVSGRHQSHPASAVKKAASKRRRHLVSSVEDVRTSLQRVTRAIEEKEEQLGNCSSRRKRDENQMKKITDDLIALVKQIGQQKIDHINDVWREEEGKNRAEIEYLDRVKLALEDSLLMADMYTKVLPDTQMLSNSVFMQGRLRLLHDRVERLLTVCASSVENPIYIHPPSDDEAKQGIESSFGTLAREGGVLAERIEQYRMRMVKHVKLEKTAYFSIDSFEYTNGLTITNDGDIVVVGATKSITIPTVKLYKTIQSIPGTPTTPNTPTTPTSPVQKLSPAQSPTISTPPRSPHMQLAPSRSTPLPSPSSKQFLTVPLDMAGSGRWTIEQFEECRSLSPDNSFIAPITCDQSTQTHSSNDAPPGGYNEASLARLAPSLFSLTESIGEALAEEKGIRRAQSVNSVLPTDSKTEMRSKRKNYTSMLDLNGSHLDVSTMLPPGQTLQGETSTDGPIMGHQAKSLLATLKCKIPVPQSTPDFNPAQYKHDAGVYYVTPEGRLTRNDESMSRSSSTPSLVQVGKSVIQANRLSLANSKRKYSSKKKQPPPSLKPVTTTRWPQVRACGTLLAGDILSFADHPTAGTEMHIYRAVAERRENWHHIAHPMSKQRRSTRTTEPMLTFYPPMMDPSSKDVIVVGQVDSGSSTPPLQVFNHCGSLQKGDKLQHGVMTSPGVPYMYVVNAEGGIMKNAIQLPAQGGHDVAVVDGKTYVTDVEKNQLIVLSGTKVLGSVYLPGNDAIRKRPAASLARDGKGGLFVTVSSSPIVFRCSVVDIGSHLANTSRIRHSSASTSASQSQDSTLFAPYLNPTDHPLLPLNSGAGKPCVNVNGDLIVPYSDDNKVCGFTPDKRLKFVYGTNIKPDGPGTLKKPTAVACDKMGHVYICDYLNNRVTVLTGEGKYIQHVLTTWEHQIVSPRGVAVSPDGSFIVVAYGKAEVAVFKLYEYESRKLSAFQ